MTDKKDLENRIAELEIELAREREYSKNADRWIDVLFENLEFMFDDMMDIWREIGHMKTQVFNGDNMAAGLCLAKVCDITCQKVQRWDYNTGCTSALRKLRDDCGYIYVNRKGWFPKGVYDAECEGFKYPDRPRERRDKSWHRE